MPLNAYQRAHQAFREAYAAGCSIADCDQAFWLAYDGIEPVPAADEDYGPIDRITNDVH